MHSSPQPRTPRAITHQGKVQIYLQRPLSRLHKSIAVACRLSLGCCQQRAWLLSWRRLWRFCAPGVAHGTGQGACASRPSAAAACCCRCLPRKWRGCCCSLLLRRLLVAIHRCQNPARCPSGPCQAALEAYCCRAPAAAAWGAGVARQHCWPHVHSLQDCRSSQAPRRAKRGAFEHAEHRCFECVAPAALRC